MKISFVIPCYGSENTIEYVIDEISQTMRKRDYIDYEVVCVNDFSLDGVYSVLVRLASVDKRIKVINLANNGGKHSALMAGFRHVEGDVIVCSDDDGQCPLDKVWDLIDALSDDVDVAIAKYPEKKESLFKRIASSGYRALSSFLVPRPKGITFENLFVMKRFVLDEIIRYTNPYPAVELLIIQITKRFKNVKMEGRARYDGGNGNFTLIKSLKLVFNAASSYSIKPLRVSTILGFVTACAGFGFAIYIVVKRFVNPEILMGYSSIMATILVIGGMQMMLLGIVGEYLGRMYMCINNKPQYVIKNTINVDEESNNG